jgi:hypothetical protein
MVHMNAAYYAKTRDEIARPKRGSRSRPHALFWERETIGGKQPPEYPPGMPEEIINSSVEHSDCRKCNVSSFARNL